jgi:flagellar biosynthetic protein FlhB
VSEEGKDLAPSARRLQKAREEGDIPVSREFTLLGGLAGGLAVLAIQLGDGSQAPLRWFAGALRQGQFDARAATVSVLWGALPCAAGACAAAMTVTMLQTRFMLHHGALVPDLKRISPARGIKRIFSADTLVQTGKSLVKLGVMAATLWSVLQALLPTVTGIAARPAAAIGPILHAQARALIVPLVGAQAVIAGADFAWVHFKHNKKLRMSLQDQKDEHKDQDGNPQVKQRLRQLARLRGKRRMMAAVARATVVVTNPTHYAIALVYERGSRAAPRVVAKGMGEVAARIREQAALNRIPMVANPPLARALYRVELDSEIPGEHFKAVAEIVAYVFRLQRLRTRGSGL